MISTATQQLIPDINRLLAKQPIERAYLFGSRSRGEEMPDSDIDLLVTYTDNSLSLFMISKIITELSRQLHHQVDLVEEDGLKEFAKESVNRDKILIYERSN